MMDARTWTGLDGRIAVVTGGSSGIGAAAVARLTAHRVVVASFDLEESPSGQPALDLRADVRDQEQVAAAVEEVEARIGPIELVVTCAGVIGPLGRVGSIDPGAWRHTLDVNLTGTFTVMQAVVPGMVARGYGRIVTFASGAGVDNQAGQAPYNASKAAVISLTKTLAREVHRANVRVNAVCPGPVRTPMLERFMESDLGSADPLLVKNQAEHRRLRDEGQLWEPDEVLDTVIFLLSDEGSHISGQFLRSSTKTDPAVYH